MHTQKGPSKVLLTSDGDITVRPSRSNDILTQSCPRVGTILCVMPNVLHTMKEREWIVNRNCSEIMTDDGNARKAVIDIPTSFDFDSGA